MTDREQPLQSSGQKVLNSPGGVGLPGQSMTNQGAHKAFLKDMKSPRNFKGMTIEEMETALSNVKKNATEHGRASNGAQTARAVLEENKLLIQEKLDRKALERKNSREFVTALQAQDRQTIESDKAKEIRKQSAKQELAHYYKAKIAEKESERANEYRAKVQSGVEIQYFPFVEGENISKHRENNLAKMREEMRGFLQKQREEHAPRMDSLRAATRNDYVHKYPIAPVAGRPAPTADVVGVVPDGAGDDVAPHMARYPRFLTRAREHMSRRLHDAHVRKVLEDKVQETKEELERRATKKTEERDHVDDGMVVNDAIRHDHGQSKNADRKRNAQYLAQQIEESKQTKAKAIQERRSEVAGYWGPQEKAVQNTDIHAKHCFDLIQQMEVNQHRRLDERNQRLKEERRLVDNSMAEMSEDRNRERSKTIQHREVLTTTWKSQQKIREAMSAIEAM